MPSTAPWARYDPRIRLVIDGREMPCIRCNVDYELSAIPQASATLAVGRSFDGKISPVHSLAANFVDRAPAQIYITPNALGHATQSARKPGALGLAGKEVRIFDGFVTAAGFSRSRDSAQFTIQMEHWLSELGFSSVFSKSSHPTNPGEYSFAALSPTDEAGASTSTIGLVYNYITSEAITNDFWGGDPKAKIGLKPFLKFLCKQDAFMATDPHIPASATGNDAALAAINRFNSPHQQKLVLDMTADADIVKNIKDQVGDAICWPDQLANQTLWDVLIGVFCDEYLFSIVPRVEDAIAAPFIAGYRKNFTTINANEETQVEWMRGLGRPLRGIGILADTKSTTGSEIVGQGAPPQHRMGGFYSPKDAKGIIIIKQGPQWMTNLYAPSLYGHESAGATGGAIGNAVQPGAAKKNNVPDQVDKRLKTVIRPFLDKYAAALYALEKLRTRQAVCSGPFRLDIAPGSTIKVTFEGEQHIKDDPFKAPFFAHVARVSLAVDGEQPMIGTSLHLSHIRSEKENSQDTTSIAKHPLYKETFSGCGLIDLEK